MLAIDIETASPDVPSGEKPDFEDTDDFELVAIALGYRNEDGDIETNVRFREKGWGDGGAFNLIETTTYWIGENWGLRNPVLTYNGKKFDEVHLKNWRHGGNESKTPIDVLFRDHIDLSTESEGVYKDSKYGTLESVCRSAGIEVEKTYYDDYDLPQEVIEQKPDDDRIVTGEHFGEFLGEIYIDVIDEAAKEAGPGFPPWENFPEEYVGLRQLMTDYAEADIKPLFELYDRIQNFNENQTTL
jgi:hypothetical protein